MKYLMLCMTVAMFALAGCYAEEGAVTQNYTVEGPLIIVASPEEATQIAKDLEAKKAKEETAADKTEEATPEPEKKEEPKVVTPTTGVDPGPPTE